MEELVWKYKIELEDETVFDDIENKRGVKIPEELKKLVKDANAASPDKYNYILESQEEKIFGAVLSFNKKDVDVDTIFTALVIIDDKNLIPFGIDSFGNYICLNMKENTVVFWNHELQSEESTGKSLKDFLKNLY